MRGELTDSPAAKIIAGLVLSYYHRVWDVLHFAEYDHSIGFPGYPRYLVFTSF